jgi:hypothetical protein
MRTIVVFTRSTIGDSGRIQISPQPELGVATTRWQSIDGFGLLIYRTPNINLVQRKIPFPSVFEVDFVNVQTVPHDADIRFTSSTAQCRLHSFVKL